MRLHVVLVMGLAMGALAILWASCGPHFDWPVISAARVHELRRRAAFDLECDEGALQLTPLGPPEQGGNELLYFQYGVVGCGQRATYVDTNQRATLLQASWVLNTRADRAEGAPASPASSRPSTPSRQDVTSAMFALQPAVAACGSGFGEVTVTFTFAGDGALRSATATGSAPQTVLACVEAAAATATLPPFEQSQFLVRFPFRL